MANKTDTRKIAPLLRLLDREKRALLTGNLGVLTEIAGEKEKLLKQLGPLAGASTDALTGLKGKIERNQVLLSGALEGIREVSERIKTLRRVKRSLETYDQSGQRSVVTTDLGQRVEKRA
ncbi:hypothetical protein [Shimia sediminis]|uniref:hypothetical protein n=1 Tax=Shimia sediminis TaxID=2497945 RepID=UPI000F8D6E4F|nr:hypothetical protein [Shimia sediminis]